MMNPDMRTLLSLAEVPEPAGDDWDERILALDLALALERLAPQDREAVLAFAETGDDRKTARTLRIPHAEVKQRVETALARLREWLK